VEYLMMTSIFLLFQSNGEASNGKSASSQSDANAIPKPKVKRTTRTVLIKWLLKSFADSKFKDISMNFLITEEVRALLHMYGF